jgi:TolB-like protein
MDASLGPYRILKKLGAGANGEVYLAEDMRLHRRVAIKTLSVLEGNRLADVRRWRAATRLYDAPTWSGAAAAPAALAPAPSALHALRTASGRRPVLSAAAALAVAAALYAVVAPPRGPLSRAAAAAPAESSVVAVLPLVVTSGHAEDEALGAGIADTLISTLSQVPGITVVSRAATLPYRDRKKSPDEIAQSLGVDFVIDGVLQRFGDKVRVNLSLLRPGSNAVYWSRSYDGTFENILGLQSEVSSATAEALRPTLSPEDRRRIERPPTMNQDAFAARRSGAGSSRRGTSNGPSRPGMPRRRRYASIRRTARCDIPWPSSIRGPGALPRRSKSFKR